MSDEAELVTRVRWYKFGGHGKTHQVRYAGASKNVYWTTCGQRARLGYNCEERNDLPVDCVRCKRKEAR